MALATIGTLLSPLTAAQARAQFVNTLVTLGIPADQWVPGGVASTILTTVATPFAGFQNLIVQGIGFGFLNIAQGPWLANLAYYVYGVVAPVATFASGNLTLVNSGGGVYSYAPFTASFLNPVNTQVYQNVTAISLSGPSTQTITIQAVTAGSIGSSPPNTITNLVTTMLGVTCNNSAAVVGQDVISDANLRLLCQAKLGTFSARAPKGAYQYAIATAKGIISQAPVNINRQTISAASSTGIVTVYVASPSGPASTDDVNGVIANIAVVAQPDAVTVNVINATGVNDTDSITVWCISNGVLNATILTAVQNALTTFYAEYPIGGQSTTGGSFMFATGKDAAIGQAVVDSGAQPVSITGTNDLALSPGQVAVDATTVLIRFTS